MVLPPGFHQMLETETLLQIYPSHEPRASDPHYHVFNETRKRMKKLGLLKCWINNADCTVGQPIQLHHSVVEFALANIVDIAHFRELYPEFNIQSDEDFFNYIEGEAGLLPLCAIHHTGILGIHVVHYPAWLVQRVIKAGVPLPEKKVMKP